MTEYNKKKGRNQRRGREAKNGFISSEGGRELAERLTVFRFLRIEKKRERERNVGRGRENGRNRIGDVRSECNIEWRVIKIDMRTSLGWVPSCFMAQFDVGRPISRVSRCLRDVLLTMTHCRRWHKSSSSWPLFNRHCTTYARIHTAGKIAQFHVRRLFNAQRLRQSSTMDGRPFYFNRAILLADPSGIA